MSFHKVPVLIVFLILLLALVVPVSAETLLVYAPSDIADGRIGNSTAGSATTLTDLLSSTGNIATLTSANLSATVLATTAGNKWGTVYGFAWSGDTSEIPDDATIDSAIFGLYADAVKTQDYTPMNATVVAFYPVNPLSLVATDWNTRNVDLKYSNPIEYADWTLNQYNNFTITNLTAINKTGITSLLATTGYDAYAWSPTIAGLKASKYSVYDNTSGKRAFLEITYHDGADTTPPESITGLSNRTFCGGVQFSWTNPADGDYNHAYTLKDGVPNGNISSPTATVTWTGLSVAEYTISVQTVDTTGNINATMINQTVNITATCPAPMGALVRNASNLSVSTYDGSGQQVHPKVVYTSDGWNGYNYLMVMSPYPGGDDTKENPSMRYSTDKAAWEQIAGQPDPIIEEPATGFNSDPNIYLNGSTLYLFSRYADDISPTTLYYNRTTTIDGVTWTDQEILTFPYFIRSASFLYNGTGWECLAFKISDNNLYFFTSDSTGLIFSEKGAATGISVGGDYAWHGEANYYDQQYQILISTHDYSELDYFNSTNGLSWVPSESNPVLAEGTAGMWDRYLYKSSFIENGGVYEVFYGATTNSSGSWHVGYSQFPNNGYPPVASFTTNVTSGTVPLAVGFTDTSTNTPTDWDWYIDDVKFSDLQNPEYTFTEAGVYDVSLYAANGASGDWENKTGYITATNWYDLQCENQTGNITINLFSNSTSSLGWNWDDPVNITKISEDGLYVLSFDNSSDYFIGTAYSPETWHKLKIYNETDFGQLNCTTDAVPITPTPIPIMPSTESNVNPANLFQYWPYAVLVLGLLVVFKKW